MVKFSSYLLLERNIVNVEYIDMFIERFIDRLFAAGTQYGHRIEKWLKSNLRNYFLREYPVLPVTRHYALKNLKEPWVEKALERGEELYHINISDQFWVQISHVLDYFRANPNLRLERITVPDAIRQSEEWTKKLNRKAAMEDDSDAVLEVRKYPDGFRWVRLRTEKAYGREGKLMGHCVASYFEHSHSRIYSLRDNKNEPHCTIEVDGTTVMQIKGKANMAIDKKYREYVVDFINKPVEKNKYTRIDDIENIGMIVVDSKLYDPLNLPKNTTIKGHLDLRHLNTSEKFVLPEGLHVKGDLYIDHVDISFSKGLKVDGFVSAGGTLIEALPQDAKFGSSVVLRGSTLKSLPDNLKVNGNLDISETKVASLPKGLKVKGLLVIMGTRIKVLPKDLSVGSIAVGREFESFPVGFKVKGTIHMSYNTKMKTLPKGMEIGEDLYADHTNLESLPDDLKVRHIYLSSDANTEMSDELLDKVIFSRHKGPYT